MHAKHAVHAIHPIHATHNPLDTLDTVRRIATPEGIELSLRLAGPLPRAAAWLIDFALRLIVVVAIAWLTSRLGGLGRALFFVSWFLLEWLFPAWCEVKWNGMTPGKRALGLMVVHDDGRPIGWGAALTRNLLRAVDFLPAFYAFGLVAMMASRDFKRLGDLAARTIVAYRDKPPARLTIPPVPAVAPPVALALAEQRVILDLAARMHGLTEERAAELAAIPAALVGRREGAAACERVLAMANHLIGEHRK